MAGDLDTVDHPVTEDHFNRLKLVAYGFIGSLWKGQCLVMPLPRNGNFPSRFSKHGHVERSAPGPGP